MVIWELYYKEDRDEDEEEHVTRTVLFEEREEAVDTVEELEDDFERVEREGAYQRWEPTGDSEIKFIEIYSRPVNSGTIDII